MGNIGVSNEAGTKLLPLPTFGSIDFSDATVNGAPLGDASPAPIAVNYFEGKKNVISVGNWKFTFSFLAFSSAARAVPL